MKDKNMTMEDLAGIVPRGFEGVQKEFGDLDERIEKLEDQVKELQADYRKLITAKK